MSVLYAEGFTGIARGNRNFVEGNTDPLYRLGWSLQGRYSGSNVIAADGNMQTQIIADPIFADRNVYRMAKTTGSTVSFFQQARKLIDTRGFTKFVFGGVFQYDTVDTSAQEMSISIGGPTLWTSSTAAFPYSDTFCWFIIPNSGAPGNVQAILDSTLVKTPNAELVKGKPIHFEVLVEEDIRRCRVYINGTLALDMTTPAGYSFAKLAGGISIVELAYPGSPTTPLYTSWSNLYLLGVDTIHPGILGPATRVMEIAPNADVDVHFDRPTGFATNAAVMAQLFDAATPAYLTAGAAGTYDIYNAPDAVAANAAKIHGAGVKVYAMSMAEGDHALKPAVKDSHGIHETGVEMKLTLGAPQLSFADMSVNPDTSAAWTPAEIRNVGFGLKLIR